ncbi:MAG TPA: DMT family transporter [Pirellulaceae bacterium]|nr:DMT family transporter [Pirellulaceae bacterium]
MPLHLLFPLFSSIVFVIGMLYGKKAITAGASPWTSTFLSNFWIALFWAAVGVWHGELLPLAGWGQAAAVGACFVAGQMFSYLAFQHGDVSVATPVFGVKVIIVAVILAVLAGEAIGARVWIGAVLATIGVGVVQVGARSKSAAGGLTARRAALTIGLALSSATSLSLFDAGLQTWGRQWGATKFLPAAFICGGLLSCGFLPWSDRPRRIRELAVERPLIVGTLLIAVQAMSMSFSLGRFGDATRINIVYALRGLWAVGLAWLLARSFGGAEARQSTAIMLLRLAGAVLLTASVVIALSA